MAFNDTLRVHAIPAPDEITQKIEYPLVSLNLLCLEEVVNANKQAYFSFTINICVPQNGKEV